MPRKPCVVISSCVKPIARNATSIDSKAMGFDSVRIEGKRYLPRPV